MKTRQLVEIENVKGANRALKHLLERNRTESVGLGLFYGRPGLGKSRWCSRTAQDNGYIYLRLESNITPKDFLYNLLYKLVCKEMPYFEVRGTAGDIYNQILDILQGDQNITIVLDEIDYAFSNERILASIRDLVDQSLATFVLVGMERAKEKLIRMNVCYSDRCNSFFEFKPLNLSDAELIIKELCDVKVDEQLIKFIHSKCSGTMRKINKYIDAIERIAKRLKKQELSFDEIKDIIVKVEA